MTEITQSSSGCSAHCDPLDDFEELWAWTSSSAPSAASAPTLSVW